MKEKELRAGIRRMLLEQIREQKKLTSKAAAIKKFTAHASANNLLGRLSTKYKGARSPKTDFATDLDMDRAVFWTVDPKDASADPIELLQSAGLIGVKDHGVGPHSSKFPTYSFGYPDGSPGFVVWDVVQPKENVPPEKQPIPIGMLAIFAESATVEGLGGTDTIATAAGGNIASTAYDGLLEEQQALTEAMYDACRALAAQAKGFISEKSS